MSSTNHFPSIFLQDIFRFLFQTDTFAGLDSNDLMSNEGLTEILSMVAGESGCSIEDAKEIFFGLFVAAHGIASLLANNSMEYEEDHFRRVLENCFDSQMRGGYINESDTEQA